MISSYNGVLSISISTSSVPLVDLGKGVLKLLLLTACFIAQAATANTPTEANPFANTPLGIYQGTIVDGVNTFLGIPYAETTAGKNRWRQPRSVAPHEGIKRATEPGPACLQTNAKQPTSEDCLSLNVWTPEIGGIKHPVMVWIHGGGFRSGSNITAGQVLADVKAHKNPAVVVAMNYRLGPLGFFSHRSIKGKYANFALLDIIAALDWVKNNISDFGGDPNNVTIFGVSAGGMAVNMLMTSPMSKGLFHKAIAQSGYGTWPLSHTRHAKRPAALDLDGAELPSAESFSTSLVKSLTSNRQSREVLYALDGQALVDALQGFQLPFVDGQTLKAEPGIRFQQNKQHKVPFITGGNSNEGTVMESSDISTKEFSRSFGSDKKQFRKLYASDFNRDDNAGWARVFGDMRYLLTAQVQGEAMSRSQPDTWLYYVDFIPQSFRQQWIGTPHGADAWFLFNGAQSKDPSIVAFATILQTYWLNFASTGNPNLAAIEDTEMKASSLPLWPRYTTRDKRWLRLSESPAPVSNVLEKKLQLLAARYRLRTDSAR